ncbi:MAG: tetratricopeptide repeat protein [Pseudomonadota bacterium]
MSKLPKPNMLATPLRKGQAKDPSPLERQMLVTLYGQGRYAEAETLAQSMAKQYPENGFGWKVLGAVLKQMGRTADALAPMQKAALLMPMDYEVYNNLGVVLKELGRLEHAVACGRRAIELKPDYAEAHGNLGAALRDQGKLDEALASYERLLSLQPEHGEAQHQVASLKGHTTERAPVQYVTGVFDSYAEKFDAHLQEVLKYDAPQKLAALVVKNSNPPAEQLNILDLGCGTGLAGLAFAPMASQLVGVDLSTKMLEKAQARNLYQRLECSDLLPMMSNEKNASYDLIISTDVFIYIGKIDAIVTEAKRLLRPGGLFAFSIEALEASASDHVGQGLEPEYQLENTGRYSQSTTYIDRLASENKFTTLEMVPTHIRIDNSKPIHGYLVLLQG